MQHKLLAIIKTIKQKKFSLKTIFVFFVLIFIVQRCNDSKKLGLLSNYSSEYNSSNRDKYCFYENCLIDSKNYYENINDFKTLFSLVLKEPNLHNLVEFDISRMPFRCLFLGDAHFIINNYESENWVVKKNFHSKDNDENIDYYKVLEKYNLNKNNISEIEHLMKKTNIEVLTRDSGYIELCWESPIDDSSLDYYPGYLIVENKEIYETIKRNYRQISQIDINCFYFERDVKKGD